MGKRPAQIEHEIEEKRAAISARLDGVQQRVRSNVSDLKDTAKEQASQSVDATKQTLNINAQTQEHPLSMLTGALGLGVILGAASEGLPGRSNGRDGASSDRRSYASSASSNDHGGNGIVSGLITSFIGPAGATLRDELQELIRDGFASFKSNTGLEQDGQDANTRRAA